MNIFNLTEEFLRIKDILENDEITPELEEQLKVNQDEVEAKVKGYCYLKSLYEGECKVIDDEIDRLSAMKKSKTNAIDRIKDILLMVTQAFGDDGKSGNKVLKYDTRHLYTVNKDKLAFENEETFKHDKFVVYTTTANFNKEAITNIKTEYNVSDDKINSKILKVELLKHLKGNDTDNQLSLDFDNGVIDGVTIVTEPYIVIK